MGRPYLLLLLLVAACSHDSARENPLDPKLTPGVELAVSLSDTVGTATLTWTPYAGSASFAAYLILRETPGLTRVDTLAALTDVADNSFADSTISEGMAYAYRVSVLNRAGLEITSPARQTPTLNLPSVAIEGLDFGPTTASATIRWRAYEGGRFSAYDVERRASGAAPVLVASIADQAVTTVVDTGLSGNTEYHYRIVVRTDLGERLEGAERSGRFHRLSIPGLSTSKRGRTSSSLRRRVDSRLSCRQRGTL